MLHLLAFALSVSVFLPTDDAPVVSAARRLAPFEIEALLAAPERRVRALRPDLARLMALGVTRSPTFAQLVADLEGRDVIVHVVPTQNLPQRTPGQTLLVPGAKAFRFLRVQIRPEGRDEDLIAVIAHELQHAVEIAAAPDVRNTEALRTHYRRIGFSDGSDREFDTHAAQTVGTVVRRELRGNAATSSRF